MEGLEGLEGLEGCGMSLTVGFRVEGLGVLGDLLGFGFRV